MDDEDAMNYNEEEEEDNCLGSFSNTESSLQLNPLQ